MTTVTIISYQKWKNYFGADLTSLFKKMILKIHIGNIKFSLVKNWHWQCWSGQVSLNNLLNKCYTYAHKADFSVILDNVHYVLVKEIIEILMAW